MAEAARTPTKYSRTDTAGGRQPECWDIIPRAPGAWSEPRFFEWQLSAESWTDQHPHNEYNYVIAGQLFVAAGGVTVEARPGDLVLVPAGSIGRYWAPTHARMLAIYGPSDGRPSRSLGFEKLSGGES